MRRQYRAARLAWLYMTGEWPEHLIDHFDGNTLNDCFDNLFEVTATKNNQNRHKASTTSNSKLIGAMAGYKGWRARIRVNGQRIDLGTYDTPEKAHEAYMTAKRSHHWSSL